MPRTLPPPEAADADNLTLLIQLRWLAVLGQIVTIFIVHSWMGIELPLQDMIGVVAFLVVLNLASQFRGRRSTPVNQAEIFLELLLDVTALTIQLYLSGGATNPFITLYLLQVSLGAVLLEGWGAWILVAIASACFVLLATVYRPLAVPDPHHGPLLQLHITGMFVCFVLAASLLVAFIHQISRNLRARDAHLAALRQRAAEEDHIVRLGLLASGAAHELGTPLATISVILNDWRRLRAIAADAELADDLAEMQNQIGRCKAIVSGILMSSGEARGEGTLRTSLGDFFDELVAEWKVSRSPAALAYRGPDSDEVIISDPALKQVLFNVFDNALEASPGWVGISVERQAAPRSDMIVITVRDHGPGFAPQILEEFGSPYRSTKNRPGGGLGLFLVVNVVRKLGGTVVPLNEPRGASVIISLPLASLSPEETHA
ncbi:ATP-binding protein [Ancylobacter sp. 6x-1]|uniref:histidine kinase n=1 Tax=Ancylobacter crimeensis TaxID=2579147 RepID=A0ABT0D7D8_9HYPH|nr:ATP-binding protein [Ancylobacter crimeensis]MCK0195858.1 ATP-binding protein [Ancylobacter crimeensis]